MSHNPFPGPQPYRRDDRDKFFARDDAVKNLSNQILARRATTVFGPSGAGKSSLMQAGVIPLIERKDGVRVVRVDAWRREEKPRVWLAHALYDGFQLGTPVDGVSPMETIQKAVALAFRRSDAPILIYLDQLEQIFLADHADEEILGFRECLAWLIEPDPRHDVHLVISLREDYLGRWRDFTRDRPDLSVNGFRVPPLSVKEMVDAVCKTAEMGSPSQRWSDEKIRPLMLDIRVPGQRPTESAEVHTAFAQIVCRALWERGGPEAVHEQLVAEAILHRYLDETLASLGRYEQQLARTLLEEHLIDGDGHRRPITENEACLVVGRRTGPVLLETLERARILHAEDRLGTRLFELGHDWLAKKVWERRNERRAAEATILARTNVARKLANERRSARASRNVSIAAGVGILAMMALSSLAVAEWHVAQLSLQAESRARKDATEDATRALAASRLAGVRELLGTAKPTVAALVLAEIDNPATVPGWRQFAVNMLQPFVGKTPWPWLSTSQTNHCGRGRKHAAILAGRIAAASTDNFVHLWNFDGNAASTLPNDHTDQINALAWHPNGTRVATASDDQTARLWSLGGATSSLPLRGHEAPVCDVAWSPDGERIATASEDKTARIWKADGTPLLVLKGHQAPVDFVAWNPVGERIVTAARDGTARIWGTRELGESLVLSGHTGELLDVAWSPDGRRVVTASRDGTARIWNASKFSPVRLLQGHSGSVTVVAWSPDGRHILTASRDATARVWNGDQPGKTFKFSGHTHWITSAAWSPAGRQFVTASVDGTARVWSLGPDLSSLVFRGHKGPILSAAWSPDGRRIATASKDGTARIWSLGEPKASIALTGHRHWVTSAAWSPLGDKIVTASLDGTVRIWNADASGRSITLRAHQGFVTMAAWSPDGEYIATASDDKTVCIWQSPGRRKPIATFEHPDAVYFIAWSPDGRKLVALSDDNTARLWTIDGSAPPRVLRGHTQRIAFAAWSPNGKQILTVSDDQTARVNPVDGSDEMVVLEGHEGRLTYGGWSPDGSHIVTAAADDTARVWNADGSSIVLTANDQRAVTSAVWSPDGKRIGMILAGKAEPGALLWSAQGTGAPVAIRGHKDAVAALVWSPDGEQVATASRDGTVRVDNVNGHGQPLVLSGPPAGVSVVSWSADASRLNGISTDGASSTWLVETNVLQGALKRATANCLTSAQRQTYLLEGESVAQRHYEDCERAHGREPSNGP